MNRDITIQEVIDWCAQNNVKPSDIILHADGSITIRAEGYPTQYAYCLPAGMKSLEKRIAEAQVSEQSAIPGGLEGGIR